MIFIFFHSLSPYFLIDPFVFKFDPFIFKVITHREGLMFAILFSIF